MNREPGETKAGNNIPQAIGSGTIGTLTAPQRHQCLQVDVISGSGWQPCSGCSYFQCHFCAMLNNIPCMAADRKMRRFLFDSPFPSLPLSPIPTPTSSDILSSSHWPGCGVGVGGVVYMCVFVCVCIGPKGGVGGGKVSIRLSSCPQPYQVHHGRKRVEIRAGQVGTGELGCVERTVWGSGFCFHQQSQDQPELFTVKRPT